MKYFLDLEFYERPKAMVYTGQITLISIGIVCENGRKYYAENAQFGWGAMETLATYAKDGTEETPQWLLKNVQPHLRGGQWLKHPDRIAEEIRAFVAHGKNVDGADPEFWGWYCAYDWVVFCWLQGRMIDLPKGWPMYCNDLKTFVEVLDIDKAHMPKQGADQHDALADAFYHKAIYDVVDSVATTRGLLL